jgi:fructose-1,6-bisphosphatase
LKIVRAAGLFRLLGSEGSTNVQGEVVKKLDVVSNEAMITALTRSDTVKILKEILIFYFILFILFYFI